MQHLRTILALSFAAATFQFGCRDNSPPPPRVASPEMGPDTYPHEAQPIKPLPAPEPLASTNVGPGPFYDQPLVVDIPPEARAFIDVYRKVGRPRIVVFVNRGLDGQIIPSSTPPASGRDRYLKSGEYDELHAKPIDYGLMESLLADWMSADNQVTIVSPTVVHRELSEQDQKDLQQGKAQAMPELARQLDADILIQVQARPTRQTREGLELRVLAEAINVKGGESLARATVDLFPPLDKPQLNRYTRFIARRLMDGMTQSWTSPTHAPANPPPTTKQTPKDIH